MTADEQALRSERFSGDVPGTIYRPSDRGTAPAVLLLHGSEGEPMDDLARFWASQGFVAAAVQYFGDADGVPDHLAEVSIDAVGRVVDALAADDGVAGERVGLYGASKGAELALATAAHVDGVGAVVSVAGSHYVWEGLHRDWRPAGASSWTLDGEPLPYVPFSEEAPAEETIRGYYDLALERADPETVEAATIPVERIDAPLLLASGVRDRMWASATYAEAAIERLEEHDAEHPCEHRSYEGAGHRIGPPGPWLEELQQEDLAMVGGTVAGTRRASEDFWPRARSLFETQLGE